MSDIVLIQAIGATSSIVSLAIDRNVEPSNGRQVITTQTMT